MRKQHTIFSTLHPYLLFTYALGAPVLAMCSRHPLFLGVTFASVLSCHGFYYGAKVTGKAVALLSPGMVLILVVNMLVNQRGVTVIFQIGHTAFTLESMGYGIANAIMLISVLLWFHLYSAVISNEKFLYLFGRRLPSTALLLSMILKLFPETKYKIRCIRNAQGGVVSEKKAPVRIRLKQSLNQISALLDWSMEDSIEMADSMKARAYGTAPRTSYRHYRWSGADSRAALILVVGIVIVCAGMFSEAGQFAYFPTFSKQIPYDIQCIVPAVCYAIFLLAPIWLELADEVQQLIRKVKSNGISEGR